MIYVLLFFSPNGCMRPQHWSTFLCRQRSGVSFLPEADGVPVGVEGLEVLLIVDPLFASRALRQTSSSCKDTWENRIKPTRMWGFIWASADPTTFWLCPCLHETLYLAFHANLPSWFMIHLRKKLNTQQASLFWHHFWFSCTNTAARLLVPVWLLGKLVMSWW